MFERFTASRSKMSLAFMPVDVPKQAFTRRLAERGVQDGRNNVPASDTEVLSLAEQEVVTDISADRERCARDLASHLRAYRDALSTLQTGMDVAGMRQKADEAILWFKEIRARWSGDVAELRRAAASADAELLDFKARHRLSRAARLPEQRFLTVALLIVAVVAESIVNGMFFATGSDLGLLGGATVAFGLSIINVGLGTIAGFMVLRQKNRTGWLFAVIGIVAFLAMEGLLVGFNGFVAHYRDLYQTTGDATKMSDAWSGLLRSPFGLDSLSSWLLFAMGAGFSGLAAWKGYGLDDPSPGYGAAERRRRDSVGRYVDERGGLLDEASEVAEGYFHDASAAIETLRASSSQREQLKGARARALADYVAHENDLAQAAYQLLATYREANRATRSNPPPAHFAQRFVFALDTLGRPEFQSLLSDQGLEHDAGSLIAELDDLRQRVLGAHELVLQQVPGEI